MFTSPKLTDPFHVVRISRKNCTGDGQNSPSPYRFLRVTFTKVERPRTIANLWRDAVAARHADPAYLHEVDGDWREVSWVEAAQAVEELANGLLSLGIQKGEAFAILGRTNLEWSLFDFALASVGAIATRSGSGK